MQLNPVIYDLPAGVEDQLRQSPKTWLVTGVAGFIGSHLLEALLKLGQTVVGLDNFATGHTKNLRLVQDSLDAGQWDRFRFIEGDICDQAVCRSSVLGVDYVLHQAALGSVPRSLEDPARSNRVNVDGFVNMLTAAKDQSVSSFVYAASSSTYGDHPGLPKVEDRIGNPLSPYGLTKWVNELYSQVFESCYGFRSIGLRYFNVYGPRQDPQGAYAAVIPKWIDAMLKGQSITINGDGETSRDFCFVANAVQANILAAVKGSIAPHRVYNVAVGGRTSLNELYEYLAERLVSRGVLVDRNLLTYGAFRRGDVAHSQADISRIETHLGYQATYDIRRGLDATVAWFVQAHRQNS